MNSPGRNSEEVRILLPCAWTFSLRQLASHGILFDCQPRSCYTAFLGLIAALRLWVAGRAQLKLESDSHFGTELPVRLVPRTFPRRLPSARESCFPATHKCLG